MVLVKAIAIHDAKEIIGASSTLCPYLSGTHYTTLPLSRGEAQQRVRLMSSLASRENSCELPFLLGFTTDDAGGASGAALTS